MDIFANSIEDDGTIDIFLQLADYYAKNMNSQKAGFFYYKGGQYSKVPERFLYSIYNNCNPFFSFAIC